ncbi:MAG: hypothetical protein ACREBU_24625, partial [Nitrososphaera sp.]
NKAYEEAESRMRNEYELKIKEAEYKKRLHPLEKEIAGFKSEEEPPKKRRAASTTELFKEKDKIDKEYAKREAAINASNASNEKKTSDKKVLDRWREEQYERIEKLFGRGDKEDEIE